MENCPYPGFSFHCSPDPALKKRGTSAENLLIDGAPKPAQTKAVKKGAAKKVAKTATKKAA